MENSAAKDENSIDTTSCWDPSDRTDEIKTDIPTKETHQLLHQNELEKTRPGGAKHFISKSTSSLVRGSSLMRPRQLITTTSTNGTNLDTTTSSSAASSKLRRLNIFCTIRRRRVPRAIRNISSTFRRQLSVLRPSTSVMIADELAARDCLLDLDDYLESISKECVSADDVEADDDELKDASQHEVIERIDNDEFAPRSRVRRHSFREAMENAMESTDTCKLFKGLYIIVDISKNMFIKNIKYYKSYRRVPGTPFYFGGQDY